MKIQRYIGSFMAIAALLTGSVACSDDLKYNENDINEDKTTEEDGDYVDVTLRFTIKDLDNVGTREGEEPKELPKFDPVAMDLLIYSVRDENDNVLTQYGRGVIDDYIRQTKAFKNDYYEYDEADDNNQTLMKAHWSDNNDGTYDLQEVISLRVMRNKVYKFSCWVQSSQTTAYDFNYLTAVKINYEDAKNNDELRNAFCSTSIFSIGQIDSKIDITLTRPCAQINVGVDKDAADPNNYLKNYNESSISLDGVAKYFNVVENKAWSDEDVRKWKAGTFGANYNKNIFNNAEKDALGNIITETEVTFEYENIDEGIFKLHDYSEWQEGTNDQAGSWTTKTYNSLSMCYVFVPEATYFDEDEDGKWDDSAEAKGDTESGVISPSLKNVNIKLKSFSIRDKEKRVKEVSYPKDGVTLDLGVKRNWRTNLLFNDWSWINGETTSQNAQ